MKELLKLYYSIKPTIENRLREFESIWNNQDENSMFKELVFCLLTPQSKAKIAWDSVQKMYKTGVLFEGSEEDIQPYIKGVRFYKNKSHYIVLAREKFWRNNHFTLLSKLDDKDIYKTRDFIVKEVKGYGYKEASHFLRNIGLYHNISILDRHIMRNMVRFGYIEELPKSLTRKRYIEIEKAFFKFANDIKIPAEHLDLLLWYKEAGEVFK